MLGSVNAILSNKPKDLTEDFYSILGCSETATVDQITAEYRVKALKCHPDKNPGDEVALQQFQRLQEARDVLSDPEKRKDYDEWRNCGVNMTYEQWKHLRNRCQMTMHWATPKKEIMLENGTASGSGNMTNTGLQEERGKGTEGELGSVRWGSNAANAWKPDGDSGNVYSAFRNYKI